jgi:hypothetical protein
MNIRQLLLVTLLLAGSAIVLDAQTRRTVGSTREDQHPASPSPSRGEERPPQSPPAVQPPPPPVNPPPPPRPVNPAPPPGPPVIFHPGPGVPVEGTAPVIILEPVPAPVTATTEVMWPVTGTEILDRLADPASGGYSFDDGEVVAFNDDASDLYFEAEGALLHTADDTDIQDLGEARSVREGLRVDRNGWEVRKEVQVQPGHQYAVWRWNGEVIRLYVQEVLDDAILFDWMPVGSIERTGGAIFGR